MKKYWENLNVTCFFAISFIVIIIIVLILYRKSFLSKRFFIISFFCLIIFLSALLIRLIPYIKDYKMASKELYLEDVMIAVEFTSVYVDSETNYTSYSEPKFYIENKDEYIVLNISNVEIGKKYRIRYLPNAKVGEIITCVEN